MEAIAQEVGVLSRHIRPCVVWGMSRRAIVRGGLAPPRLSVHPRLHLVFRAAARVLEPMFDLNHIFGTIGDWFYLSAKRRRPTVLTAALIDEPTDPALLESVDAIVVETASARDELVRRHVPGDKVRVIHPGVCLSRFCPTPLPPLERFRVLFASSPDRVDALSARGLDIMLDAAGELPDVEFVLLWRPWGASAAAARDRIAARRAVNVRLVTGRQRNMAKAYGSAHATLAPFTRTGWFKPCPNSVLESLGCARPVVATNLVGIAGLVQTEGAGVSCAPTGSALADAIRSLRHDYAAHQKAARPCAERHFGVTRFVGQYRRLYAEVLNGNGGTRGAPHRVRA